MVGWNKDQLVWLECDALSVELDVMAGSNTVIESPVGTEDVGIVPAEVVVEIARFVNAYARLVGDASKWCILYSDSTIGIGSVAFVKLCKCFIRHKYSIYVACFNNNRFL